MLSLAAEPIEKRIRVEGVKTGRVTALDLPGQIQQALAAGIVSETEAAQLRDYDRKVMEPHARRRLRGPRARPADGAGAGPQPAGRLNPAPGRGPGAARQSIPLPDAVRMHRRVRCRTRRRPADLVSFANYVQS